MTENPNSTQESPQDSELGLRADPEEATQSPEDRLKFLQAELARREEQIDKETKEKAALKADVDALTKTVDELNKAKVAFAQAAPGLRQDVGALDTYYKTKEQMVEAALGEKRKDVDNKIIEVENKIKDAKAKVARLEAAAKTACDLDTQAQKTLDAKQQAYDRQKTLQKSLGDNIKTLNSFRKQIEEFDDKTKPASMYVILRELNKVRTTSTVPEQATFDADLEKAFNELDAAKEDARQKKLACEAAQAEVVKAQAALAALEKSRVEDILKATEPLNK